MFNLLFFVLLISRFYDLALKPAHHDESINGWFVSQMWNQGGSFTYDPTNYHGPLLFYLFQWSQGLGGWGIEPFRFVTVLFSCFTLIWLYQWTRRRFDLSGWWLIGLALSPGFLFFSRSGIHESPLVFFTVMAATSWIDFWVFRKSNQILVFLYGLLGMLLLKETFAIPLALAILLTAPLFVRREFGAKLWALRHRFLFHLAVTVFLWAAFYSGLGRDFKGLLDFFRAFLPWTNTGVQGNGHEKPAIYFLKLIWENEPATVLALVLSVWGLFGAAWVRSVCLWSLGILGAYSAIRYKTPWCLISIQIPLWISAGVVLGQLPSLKRKGAQVLFVLSGLSFTSLWIQLNFKPLQPHPYVYVQTSLATRDLAKSVNQQAGQRPELYRSKIQIGTQESWPFPWLFENFPNNSSLAFPTGFVDDADLYLIDVEHQEIFEAKLKGEFWRGKFEVRDSRGPAFFYARKSKFECPVQPCEEVTR